MKRVIIFCIKAYQRCISHTFAGRCRFTPSCSKYAIYAIETHGLVTGLVLTVKRILRCRASLCGRQQSAGKTWGYDPVPTQKTQNTPSQSNV
ncbi:MAG: membrane protein insertion efficiency factor YidD [Holosporales bacterium]|nr:membrane protein insertion efficiency factor YidD [Holosporales bacterium]